MIAVRLEGGLGNQLFQYAAGRALAFSHGTGLLLDISTLLRDRRGRVTPRDLELNHFKHVARLGTPSESRLMPWLHRIPAVSRLISPWQTFVEKGLDFNPPYSRLPDNTYLVGYWQSYRYLANISSLLASELQPVAALSPASNEIAEQIEACMSVSVHVRRGDYVTLASAASIHGTLPFSYYKKAFECVQNQIGPVKYFVFSDDAAWCRENLQVHDRETVFISHNVGDNAWQDLILMGRCRHHIIANSSFSWWGAWLADQHWSGSPRLVVAPKRWFAGLPDQNLRDRFPPHWMILS
jgi:hypothetical protein